MKATVTYLTQPLVNLNLQGLHLIEASAGTGKTWTLSSLMVRILTEKYMPRQVIATTFTRAAAAELKSRIRKRLLGIYQQSQDWEQQHPTNYATIYNQLKDPLEKLIFQQFQDYSNDQKNFNYLVNRLRLVIDSLDELFVGTIDSFTQKLLREFSFESGEIIPRLISDDEKQYSYQIVHDLLRAWLQSQSQQLIDLLLFSKSLGSVDDYIVTVQSTLNFGQAKLQAVHCPTVNAEKLEQAIQTFKACDLSTMTQLTEYYRADGQYAKQWDGRTWKKGALETLFTQVIPELRQSLSTIGLLVLFDKDFQAKHQINGKKSKTILDVLTDIAEQKGVKNPEDQVMQLFYQHPLIQAIQNLVKEIDFIKDQLQELDQYLRFYLSTEVKKTLPQVLTHAGETTFTQQIRSLEQALVQGNGTRLAQAIGQRYPMILVDEFQDTNQEQDNVLRSIWRDQSRSQQCCFIAVGDPKQAIYGFRGGDILTYLNAFNDIASKHGQFYRLEENFRSVPKLVEAVDALFLRQTDFAENIHYYPAKIGQPDAALLIENGMSDQTPLRWMQFAENQNDEEAYYIAQKIHYLLAQVQQQKLYIEHDGKKTVLLPEDIAVLAYSNRELDQVQKQLQALHINVNRTSLTSVFESQSAQDVGAILQAIEQPDRSAILKRALLTAAIGKTLMDFQSFEQYPELLNEHIQNFRHARQLWVQKGFLTAWQYLAEHYRVWTTVAQNTTEHTERTIVNMRHLIEVLSQHSQMYSSLQHLMQWYQLQLGSPAQREWELERKLSNASGVQLMTIHKSKGLEFKIVFLMHANKEIKTKMDGLAFYQEQVDSSASQQQPSRIIAVSKNLIANNDAALQADQQKTAGENHRLWYVALTRASYRIYAILHHQKNQVKQRGAADYWYFAKDEIFENMYSNIEPIDSPQELLKQADNSLLELVAQPYPKVMLYPKTRTSFSYMASHLKQQHVVDVLADVTEQNTAAEDEKNIDIPELDILDEYSSSQSLAWIRENFPKGANAGNCLHEIFEEIDFQNTVHWDKIIRRSLYHYGLWEPLYHAFINNYPKQSEIELKQLLFTWIMEIIRTPIQQHTNLCLQSISSEHRLVEFPFFLALANHRFDTHKIYQLFLDEGFEMPMFEAANTARYLNGAIDLVYFDGSRYHIADYKSNYLGKNLQHYQMVHVENSMMQSSYWLQASIYLVALHRYLTNNLERYDIKQHLGGASYLYLRGMTGDQIHGVKYWQPSYEFILKLDQLLGYVNQISDVHNSVDNYV